MITADPLVKRRPYQPPTGRIASCAVRVAQNHGVQVIGPYTNTPSVRWMRAVRARDGQGGFQRADGYSRSSARSKWEGNSSLKSLVGRSKSSSRRHKTAQKQQKGARKGQRMARRVAQRWIRHGHR